MRLDSLEDVTKTLHDQGYVSDPSLLPERYQKRIETDTIHRVACDYIAGMTDRFCKEERRRLRG